MAGSSGQSGRQRFWRKRKGREPLNDLISQMLMAQRASEERFLQMEERRMEQEQEAEERRLRLEERRLQLDRQHELRMFTIFAQMLGMIRQGGGGGGGGEAVPPTDTNFPPEGDIVDKVVTSRVQESAEGDVYNCNHYCSPYLSTRGNILSGFRGSSEEGYRAYHEDKYDEDKNPNVSQSLGEDPLERWHRGHHMHITRGHTPVTRGTFSRKYCEPTEGLLQ